MAGINRQPRGLLNFLGIQNVGRNPGQLGEQLSPVIDLRDWYLQQNTESVALNSSVASLGFNPFFSVPDTETWAVISTAANSAAALGAGVTFQIGVAWSRPSPTVAVISPLSEVGPVATTGAVAVAWGFPADLIFVPPGAQIGIYCSQLAAGPVSCNLHLVRVVMGL